MNILTPKFNWRGYAYGSISLCMIMKNEAKRLQRCLNSVRGLVNDIIICDTGSTDGSVEIARQNGCKVLSDPWQNDFSRPRNISISAAKSDWILILDPDEVILRRHHHALKELTLSKKFVAYQLTTRNYARNPHELNYRTLLHGLDPSGQFSGFVPSTKTRFFKNGLGIIFEGCWHELLDWYILRNKLLAAQAPIPIHHWANEMTQSSRKEKADFYIALGEKKVKEWPTCGQAWWELGVAEAIQGFRYRAARSLLKAFSLGFGSSQQYATLARIYNMNGDKEKGALAFEKAVCGIYPNLTHIEPRLKTLDRLIK